MLSNVFGEVWEAWGELRRLGQWLGNALGTLGAWGTWRMLGNTLGKLGDGYKAWQGLVNARRMP